MRGEVARVPVLVGDRVDEGQDMGGGACRVLAADEGDEPVVRVTLRVGFDEGVPVAAAYRQNASSASGLPARTSATSVRTRGLRTAVASVSVGPADSGPVDIGSVDIGSVDTGGGGGFLRGG